VSVTLDDWWGQLRAAALVGTARRDVPPLPALGVVPRDGTTREEALLDAAALGDAVRRAGRVAEPAPEPDDPAPAETLAVAPPGAVQILELLVTQGPVGGASRGVLTVHWYDTAAAAGRVVPARLLPQVLDLATTSAVRRAARAVVGERGRWLAARNPDWSWVTDEGRAEQAADRVSAIASLRSADPDAGRALVEQTWATDSAQHRAAALGALRVGLGPADEPFLERCLDDRARSVREEACRLLDRLPGSARAARMADRLRPLLSYSGGFRRRLDVLLPDDPDVAAARDGLVDPGPVGSRRAYWRDQVVRGAPLEVWTDAVRGGPEKVVTLVRGYEDSLLLALVDAAAGRGDVPWARALLAVRPDTRLLALLPPDERERHLLARLSAARLGALSTELAQVPRPWGPDLSRAVLAAVSSDATAGHAVRALRDVLPTALHPSTLPAVEKAMHAVGDDTFLRTTLRDVLQFQSLHRSISEAFR
jgi:hypothetical protein